MKHILITGGNAGIGIETAIALAKQGSKIIIACRNESKITKAIEEIKATAKSEEIYGLQCDLASFDSVRACIETYRNQFGQLDVLINNAGLIATGLQFTKEGYELTIGVNHLGHFLLTKGLIDLLEKSNEPRIVNVSSTGHYKGEIDFDTFRGQQGEKKYDGMKAYSQSKLANVLFTKELVRRYPSITSHSLHPGVVGTEIAEKNDNKTWWKVVWKIFKPVMLSPAKGARTTVHLASSPEALKSNGKYWDKQKEKAPSDLANDASLAQKLWEVSEECLSV